MAAEQDRENYGDSEIESACAASVATSITTTTNDSKPVIEDQAVMSASRSLALLLNEPSPRISIHAVREEDEEEEDCDLEVLDEDDEDEQDGQNNNVPLLRDARRSSSHDDLLLPGELFQHDRHRRWEPPCVFFRGLDAQQHGQVSLTNARRAASTRRTSSV